jgi:hypothetical protein
MSPVTREESLSRTLPVFLFGFSYYGVLKIRRKRPKHPRNMLCTFPDFWRCSVSVFVQPGLLLKRDAAKADQYVLGFANPAIAKIDIWKVAGKCKELGAA